MTISAKSVALLLGTALASSAWMAPAMAQKEAPAAASNDSLDIVVTARRIQERLQDVPISITVFNQKQLAARNIQDGVDLSTYTPSLQPVQTLGRDNAKFSIRGFVPQGGTAASVGVYFADVVVPRGGASLDTGDGAGVGDFFDLENVQVLKGPQGTLFGRNTTGGAILLVPQKPSTSSKAMSRAPSATTICAASRPW